MAALISFLTLLCLVAITLAEKISITTNITPITFNCHVTWERYPNTYASGGMRVFSANTPSDCKAQCATLPFCVGVQVNDNTDTTECSLFVSRSLFASSTYASGFTQYRLTTRCGKDDCKSNPCLNTGVCEDAKKGYQCHCLPGYTGLKCETVIDECASSPCSGGAICVDAYSGYKCLFAHSCAEIYTSNPSSLSGVYNISVQINGEYEQKQVYCNMSHGGGWTVFQRRVDGSVDFYRPWIDYVNGFGDLDGNFWLGLDVISALTGASRKRLRVDLEDRDGKKLYAEYDNFTVSDASDKYRLENLGEYTGTAGDSFSFHWRMQFSTYDNDNDLMPRGTRNCAEMVHGAWWFNDCLSAHLNGDYNATDYNAGVVWLTVMTSPYSQKYAQMMLRPANW